MKTQWKSMDGRSRQRVKSSGDIEELTRDGVFHRQKISITVLQLYANYFDQRRKTSAMTNWSETPGQRARRLLGARLDGTWPNTRPSPRPRGLQRMGMACYRIAALQMLAHMPKFVN
jgi:hypothetical protein